MEFRFTVQTKIKKPLAEVFNAVVDEKKIVNYFTDKSNGPLQEGKTVTWSWAKYGEYPVTVQQVVPNEKIVFEWASHKDKFDWEKPYTTQVIFDFENLDDGATLLKITEGTWPEDQNGLKCSYDNCAGWQHMALSLKAYLENGINFKGAE